MRRLTGKMPDFSVYIAAIAAPYLFCALAGMLLGRCDAALRRLILAVKGVDGWSDKVADTRLDHRVRYPDIEEDRIFGVESADEAIAVLEKYLNLYTGTHTGIKRGD